MNPLEIAAATIGGLVDMILERPLLWALLVLTIIVLSIAGYEIAEHRGWRGTGWLIIATSIFAGACAVTWP